MLIGLSHQNRPQWSPDRTDFDFAKTGIPGPNLAAKIGSEVPVLAAKSRGPPLPNNGPPLKWIVRHAPINLQTLASLHASLHWHATALHACIIKTAAV